MGVAPLANEHTGRCTGTSGGTGSTSGSGSGCSSTAGSTSNYPWPKTFNSHSQNSRIDIHISAERILGAGSRMQFMILHYCNCQGINLGLRWAGLCMNTVSLRTTSVGTHIHRETRMQMPPP